MLTGSSARSPERVNASAASNASASASASNPAHRFASARKIHANATMSCRPRVRASSMKLLQPVHASSSSSQLARALSAKMTTDGSGASPGRPASARLASETASVRVPRLTDMSARSARRPGVSRRARTSGSRNRRSRADALGATPGSNRETLISSASTRSASGEEGGSASSARSSGPHRSGKLGGHAQSTRQFQGDAGPCGGIGAGLDCRLKVREGAAIAQCRLSKTKAPQDLGSLL